MASYLSNTHAAHRIGGSCTEERHALSTFNCKIEALKNPSGACKGVALPNSPNGLAVYESAGHFLLFHTKDFTLFLIRSNLFSALLPCWQLAYSSYSWGPTLQQWSQLLVHFAMALNADHHCQPPLQVHREFSLGSWLLFTICLPCSCGIFISVNNIRQSLRSFITRN